MLKGETVIAVLNRLVEFIEDHLTEEIDIAGLASSLGTTEYHLRRMFSSLAGMPLSEYIRRRRMAVAAADVARRRRPAGQSRCATATARPRRSAERSGRCTASAPATCAETVAPFAHNRSSGSA